MKAEYFVIILAILLYSLIGWGIYHDFTTIDLERELDLRERELDQDFCFKKCDRLSWQIETDWTGERWIMCVDECLERKLND